MRLWSRLRGHTALTLTFLSVASAAAQSPTELMLKRAETALADGRKEVAAAELRRAERTLLELRFMRTRKALDKQIFDLATKADKDAGKLRSAQQVGVKALLAAAGRSHQKRQYRLAVRLADTAALIGRGNGREDVLAFYKKIAEHRAASTAAAHEAASGVSAARAALGAATVALAESRTEDAILRLLDARHALGSVDDLLAVEKLGERMTALAIKAGPLGAPSLQAVEKAGQSLCAMAARYRERGWKRTALEILELAARVDPLTAFAPLVAARDDPGDNYIGSSDLLYEFFVTFDNVTGSGAWTILPDSVHSPRLESAGELLLISGQELKGNAALQLRAAPATGPCRVGLIFAYKSRQDYHMLELNHSDTGTWIQLLQRKGEVFEKLAYGFRDQTDAQREGENTLWVAWRGKQIECRVNDTEILTGEAKVEDLGGRLGLFVHPQSTQNGGIEFRELLIERL